MQCPKCNTTSLKQGKVKETEVTVDYCTRCKGIWFDNKELEAAFSTVIKALTVPLIAQEVELLCPKCGEFLLGFNYPQTYVEIDMCRKCKGLWLDSGEFKEIRLVRTALQKSGESKEQADVSGLKGKLLDFIDIAISTIHGDLVDF